MAHEPFCYRPERAHRKPSICQYVIALYVGEIGRMSEAGDARRQKSDSESLHAPPRFDSPWYRSGYIATSADGKDQPRCSAKK
jgi:hypothetical protein